jgi:hypothetical protein
MRFDKSVPLSNPIVVVSQVLDELVSLRRSLVVIAYVILYDVILIDFQDSRLSNCGLTETLRCTSYVRSLRNSSFTSEN